MDETSLITHAAAGDDDALTQLLKQHSGAIEACVREAFPRRLASQLSVDDVLQSVYADAFLSVRAAHFADARDFPAWLRTIARNNLRDLVRFLDADKRGGGRAPVTADRNSTQMLLLELLSADSSTPSREIRRDEAASVLQAALARLPEDERRAIQLVELEERSIDDVARELGRTRGGVNVLRHRARRRLAEILDRQRTIFRSFL